MKNKFFAALLIAVAASSNIYADDAKLAPGAICKSDDQCQSNHCKSELECA